MAKRTTQSTYQYEPLVTPAKWQGDERRFSIRLSQLLDDLFGKFGRADTRLRALEEGTGSSVAPLDAYPVGSIFMSSENVNPGETFGGEWELVDKLLKAASYNQNTNAITINTNNVASLGTCLITVDGNTMEIYVTLTTKVALADQDVNLFALNLEAIGVSSLAAKRIVGNSDGGNGFVNASVNSAGNVLATDVVTKTSGANMAADVGVQFSATWKINKNSRIDAFCDRFFWKRTA